MYYNILLYYRLSYIIVIYIVTQNYILYYISSKITTDIDIIYKKYIIYR